MGVGFKIKNKMVASGPIQALNGALIGANGTSITQLKTGSLNAVVGTVAAGTTTAVNIALASFGTADLIFGMGNPSNLQNGVHFCGFRPVAAGTVAALFHPTGAAAGTVNGTVAIPYMWVQ